MIARLVRVYQDLGRTDDARDVLLQNLKPMNVDYYDQDYQQAMLIGNKFWAAEKLQSMKHPLDALLLFQELSSEDSGLSRAASWNGDSIDGMKRRISAGLAKALESIHQTDPDEAVQRLLAIDDKRQSGEPLFDLMLTVPAVADATTKPVERISSRFGELLRKIAATGALRENVQKRLIELQQEHPDDVSVAITQVLLAGDAERLPAMKSLAEFLKQHPLDEIPDGRRPNSRQRRAALAVFPVWIVAREGLQQESQRETALFLAEQALQAARRQVKPAATSALLMEWGRDALQAGDTAEAERRWSQLLDIVTERPTRKSTSDRKTSGGDARRSNNHFSYVAFVDGPAENPQPAAEIVPPLTLSQFNMATRIAVEAAKAGMSDLSQRAVRELLAGGLPVPDVTSTNSPTTAVPSRSLPDLQAVTSNAEQLVAKSLLEIVSHWNPPAYDPETVYQLLMPVILPPARAKEILLFADSSQLDAAQFSNAGQAVIEWAAKANRLDDLTERILQRQSTGPSELPARVLLVNIALKQGNLTAAEEQLQLLKKTLQQGASDTLATLACHAALPAAEQPKLVTTAMQIVRQAVQLRAQTATANNNDASIGELHRRLLRHLAAQGEQQAVGDFFRDYMQARQSYYSRYGGDYGLYVQWGDWAKVSKEAAILGSTETALDYLGRASDFSHRNYSRPSTESALAAITSHVRRRPVAEQYALWRDWTLPTESRRTVRLLVETVAPNQTPLEFLPPEQQKQPFPDRDVLSNANELMDAAEATGKLAELRPLVERAYQEQLANAEFLWPLLLIRLGDLEAATPVLNELSKNIRERNAKKDSQQAPDVMREYLVYQACLQAPRFGPLYAQNRQKLRDVLQTRHQRALLSRLDVDFAKFRAGSLGADVVPGADPELKYWLTASTDRVPTDSLRPWWTVIENQLVHLSGPGRDTVCFRAPLQGDFEFQVDILDDGWAEADAGYNGLIVESLSGGNRTNLVAVGDHETVRLQGVLPRARPALHQLTVRVNQGTMSYWQNNQLVYKEELSGTSPWLLLATDRSRQSLFQNLRITGQPTVPDQITLVQADRLDGWNAKFFNESQPRHRLMAQKYERESEQYLRRDQQNEPTEFDWRAKDGVLQGRAVREVDAEAQSWIYYHRPLQSGETFAYEFQYQPGESVAHPTLGRIAYQLTPQGVVEHWITRPDWDETICGIPADNEFTSAESRRGPANLPFQVGDWNRVELSLVDQKLTIQLNGTLIYEAAAKPLPDARFGLFRLKRQSATVRKVTLSGPWREMFPEVVGQDLLATTREQAPSQRQVLGQLMQENNIPPQALAVVMRARTLPDDQAYDLLKAWVLRGSEHDSTRLYYEHRPYQSMVEIAAQAEDERAGPVDAGEVVSPAVELVNLAHRLGRLEELAREVAPGQAPPRPIRQREQAALAVLISIAAGEPETAVELMKQLDAAILAGLPNGKRPHTFAPEGLVCRAAARQPRLVLPAWELAQRLVDESREADKKRPGPWKDEATDILGDVERQIIAAAPVGVSGSPQSQWRSVPYLKPNHLFDGQHPSTWYADAGVLQHLGGLTWGQLYFQSPLRGKFEVVADRALHGYREVSISYGSYAAGPKYDYKAVEVSKVMRNKTDAKPLQELKRPDATLSGFRMVVDGQRVTTEMDGVPIHQQYMDRPAAPWLMLQASGTGYRPYVANLRIVGEPEIPDELDLLDSWSTGFWRGDYYVGQFTGESRPENATWKPEQDELVGNLVESHSGEAIEGLLRYQRPMLEDGTIRFEAFYFPGEYEVHPALGGHAFLIQPDGVQRHALTGGAYERSGRSPDNAASIPNAAPQVPLKSNDWNTVVCRLHGNQLTINVNGQEVVQHTVGEIPEERFFGLFRFANQTKARVRNIRYRGEWPKTLPLVAEQALAQGPQGILPPSEQKWLSTLRLDARQPIAEINQGAFRVNGATAVARSTPEGLHLKLATVDGQRKNGNIVLNTLIAGDVDVTLDYEKFNATQATSGWGNAAMLRLVLDDPTSPYVEIGLTLRDKGQPQLRVVHRHTRLDGQMRYDTIAEPQLPAAGRLRLVRRGGVIYGLFAEPGSDVFRHVGSALAGADNVRRVEFVISASDQDSTIDTVVKQLTVQSNTPAEPLAHAPR
ncbi:MAG: DUF1583 domain-containing protein [Planctomycetaceae bacterium]